MTLREVEKWYTKVSLQPSLVDGGGVYTKPSLQPTLTWGRKWLGVCSVHVLTSFLHDHYGGGKNRGGKGLIILIVLKEGEREKGKIKRYRKRRYIDREIEKRRQIDRDIEKKGDR